MGTEMDTLHSTTHVGVDAHDGLREQETYTLPFRSIVVNSGAGEEVRRLMKI